MTASPARDLVVVGGGPAGLAVAIRARLAGLSVVVLERGGRARDKACGEGLMPPAVAQLEALGVGFDAGLARPFRGIRFVQRGAAATARFGRGEGLGVRRTVLHDALARRAEELGADVRYRAVVQSLSPEGAVTDDGLVRARVVVGADGLHSRVRRWARLDGTPGRVRFGLRRHFHVRPWTDCVEVHWADGCEAYVTPVGPTLVGVNVTWCGSPSRFDELLARFPTLSHRLAGAPAASEDRGAGPMHQRTRGVLRGNVALLGDAAGYLDSIAGEGLAIAFAEAEALVDAVIAGDLARYVPAHRSVRRVPTAFTRALLALTRRPRLRAATIAFLARHETLFSRLLDLSAGTRSLSSLRARGLQANHVGAGTAPPATCLSPPP